MAAIGQSQIKGSGNNRQETELREVGIHHSSLATIRCLGRRCLFRGRGDRRGNRKPKNGKREPLQQVKGGGVDRDKHKVAMPANSWWAPEGRLPGGGGLGLGGGADGN